MIFMQLPGISGDVVLSGYDGWIAVDSVSYGVDRDVMESGKAGTEDINLGVAPAAAIRVSKGLDDASTQLMQLSVAGTGLSKAATIHLVEQAGTPDAKPIVYLEIKLDRPIVKSWEIHAAEDDRPSEALDLLYSRIAFKSWTIADGRRAQEPRVNGWDFVYNKPWAG